MADIDLQTPDDAEIPYSLMTPIGESPSNLFRHRDPTISTRASSESYCWLLPIPLGILELYIAPFPFFSLFFTRSVGLGHANYTSKKQ